MTFHDSQTTYTMMHKYQQPKYIYLVAQW